MPQNLKVGQRVEFNIGKPDGLVMQGVVTRVMANGASLIQPDRPNLQGVQFFNIKPVETK